MTRATPAVSIALCLVAACDRPTDPIGGESLPRPSLDVAATGSWAPVGDMTVPRRDHHAVTLDDGRVLIVGWYYAHADLFDPVTNTFSSAGTTQYLHQSGGTMTRLDDGRVLIVGGVSNGTTAEVYEPGAGAFVPHTGVVGSRTAHTATLLQDGRVLLSGGQQLSASGLPVTHALAEVFDPGTGTFSETGSLNEARSSHVAALLPDGRVLIAGGVQATDDGQAACLAAAEVYDPSTGVFTTTGSMTSARCSMGYPGGILLSGGRVLVGGGWSAGTEIWDPATRAFSAGPAMQQWRFGSFTTTPLADGRVLVAGGYHIASTGAVGLASAEIFDPATETFTATESMASSRQQSAAALLHDGRVLVAGGFSWDTMGELALAEVFTPARTREIIIDVRPGDAENVVHCGRGLGVLSVAILTTAGFDATTVDHATVAVEGAGETHLGLGGLPTRHEEDVDGDGDVDLVIHVRVAETAIACGATSVVLTARTWLGEAIEGRDFIRTVGG